METDLSCFSWQPPCQPESRADTVPCFPPVPLGPELGADCFVFLESSTRCLGLDRLRFWLSTCSDSPNLGSGACPRSTRWPSCLLMPPFPRRWHPGGYSQTIHEKRLPCGEEFFSVQIRAEEAGRGERRGEMSSITQKVDGRSSMPADNDDTGRLSRHHASSGRLGQVQGTLSPLADLESPQRSFEGCAVTH